MKISKKNKKRIIQGIFLIPFITCLVTIIGIKHFVDHDLSSVCGTADTRKVFIVVAMVLFINVLASFASLISYWCLENKVDSILRKERKKHHARKN